MFPTINIRSTSAERVIYDVSFSDVNAQFSTQQSEFVYEADAAIQAFLILLSTPKGSRWWRPEYGTVRLLELLFEPFDDQTADEIVSVIQMTGQTSANGYTGVELDEVKVKLDYATSTYVVELVVDIPILREKGKEVRFGLTKLGN